MGAAQYGQFDKYADNKNAHLPKNLMQMSGTQHHKAYHNAELKRQLPKIVHRHQQPVRPLTDPPRPAGFLSHRGVKRDIDCTGIEARVFRLTESGTHCRTAQLVHQVRRRRVQRHNRALSLSALLAEEAVRSLFRAHFLMRGGNP